MSNILIDTVRKNLNPKNFVEVKRGKYDVLEELSSEKGEKDSPLVEKIPRSIFMTGPAGTGKSFKTNQLLDCSDLKIIPTASTGIAANNLEGGITIHKALGCMTRTSLNDFLFITSKMNLKLKNDRKAWFSRSDVLLIDEISMISSEFLDLIDQLLRYYRDVNAPFGGMLLVLVGDLYQLPPVCKNKKAEWFFKSRVWSEIEVDYINLTEQHRQSDPEYIQALNILRTGEGDITKSKNFLNRRCLTRDYVLRNKRKIKEASRIFFKNVDVNHINTKKYTELKTEEKTYKAHILPNPYENCPPPTAWDVFSKYNEDNRIPVNFPDGEDPITKYYRKGTNTPLKKFKILPYEKKKELWEKSFTEYRSVLKLKVGCKVKTTFNHPDGLYQNGTRGEIIELKEESVVIRTIEGSDVIVRAQNFNIVDSSTGKIKGCINQIPLKLNWASTAHSMQGITMGGPLIVSIENSSWLRSIQDMHSLKYVACSRSRKVEDLHLQFPIEEADYRVDPEVKQFMQGV